MSAEVTDRCEHCGRTAHHAEVVVRVSDMERVRLFVWELRMLADDMRVAASPFADRLERALDRFTDDDDGAES